MDTKLAILLALLSLYRNLGAAGTASEAFQKVSPSVVLITTEDEKGQPLALGTGFVVAKDTVASNFHVVSGATGAKVKVLGQRKTHQVVGIVAASVEKDVALLRVIGIEAPQLKLRTGSPILVGETIYAIGNPKGLEGTISAGIVSAHRRSRGAQFFRLPPQSRLGVLVGQ